ncbi:MAG: hypothetical protein WCR68_00670 [Candidatus Dojkabacteria bacterium]|jgi:hypothetical protein|nr:hypothetical protein [Candidatus Dojkabacteria bacterium]
MKTNLEKIAQNNLKVLQKYRLTPYIDSQTIQDSIKGGDLFMQSYLTNEQFKLFQSSVDLKDDFDIKKEEELVNEILKNDVCLITIRPEMTHYTENIIAFLQKENLLPIQIVDHKLSEQQYWDLYHRGITTPNARTTMATRTIVYTSSEVTTVVFKNLKPKQNYPVSNYLFNSLKGSAKEYSENTLRGDLIRNEAKRMGLNNMNMDKTTALAIDPFGTYRNMLKQEKDPSNKLFQYTAVSVHIPNRKELARDLSVLLDYNQLTSVINNL